MKYEYDINHLNQWLQFMGTEYKQKGNEYFLEHCPICGGGSHGDKYTFSVNCESGLWDCKRASCGEHGNFLQLANATNFYIESIQLNKQYKKLPPIKPNPKQIAYDYFLKRGISHDTCDRFFITTKSNQPYVIAFPFLDENYQCQMYKYRDTKNTTKKNKEFYESDCKPILFGMAQCSSREQLVVTEGQIDAMSLAECGIENAVSVPGGCNGSTWVPFCNDFVNEFKEIVIFGDFENGHITLVDMFRKHFPHKVIKVIQQTDYLMEKDANDLLMAYGKNAIIKAVENAKPIGNESIIKLKDITCFSEPCQYVRTGFDAFDRDVGGIPYGGLTVITGKRGHGKSTLVNQIIVNACNNGLSSFVYSGELKPSKFKEWLMLNCSGKKHIKLFNDEYGHPIPTISDEVINKISDWIGNKVYIYQRRKLNQGETEYSAFISSMKLASEQYGITLFVIDNLMSLGNIVSGHDSIYDVQRKVVLDLCDFAREQDVAVILVAHPRKTSDNRIGNDDVSGTSNITDSAELVLRYERNIYDIESNDAYDDSYDNRLFVLKDRNRGTEGTELKLVFDRISKRLAPSTRFDGTKRYTFDWSLGWEHM